MAQQRLQALDSIISTPFITASFGGEEFGLTSKMKRETRTREVRYITALDVAKKASGTVNTYKLGLNYVIEPGADPNYLDLILSKAQDRTIHFTYGDASQPEFSYVRERAVITKVMPNMNLVSNSISYTIEGTSSVSINYTLKRNYPPLVNVKPSDIIFKELYENTSNGLLDLFEAMQNRDWVEREGIIARNDLPVNISGLQDASPLEYLRFLVSAMRSLDDSFYAMVIHDEDVNPNGHYFSVVNSTLHQGKGNRYSIEIDVGYPSSTPVFGFSASQQTSLAIITPYQEKFDYGRIIDINNDGSYERTSVPSLAIREGSASPALLQWWKQITSFPINAVLKTRGLIRPSILCDYIKINIYFFGQKYNYSGYYMVVGQDDHIGMSGYTTSLSLVRIKGDF